MLPWRNLLEGARERARTLLSQHRAVLDALAGELIAKETVSGVRLAEIAMAVDDPDRGRCSGRDPIGPSEGVTGPSARGRDRRGRGHGDR